MFMKQTHKEVYLLIALLCTSVVSVYFMPAMLSRLIFLGILVAVYNTKMDYVYLVWFFVINNAPGLLFSGGEFDAKRIPLYPVVSGISVSFQDLFLLLYLFKFIRLKKPFQFIFKKEFRWFFMYTFSVVAYSLLLGMSFKDMISTFRVILPWSLIFILPTYIYNREIVVRVCLLMFPMVLLALASQIFSYISGAYLDHWLRGLPSWYVDVAEGHASRSYSAVYIILFSIIQALFFVFGKKDLINKNYLSLIIFTGAFSVFLAATRGWIIAIAFMLVSVLLFFGFSREATRWFRLAVLSVAVFFIVESLFPVVHEQVKGSSQRMSTLEALAKGDVTARGTLKRLDVRVPRVLNKFWESPVIGWGFSSEYQRYQDSHVGQYNLLLQVGVIGYVFFNGLFVVFCLKIWRMGKNPYIRKVHGKAMGIYILGMLAGFIIHSTSVQFWGINMGFDHMQKVLFWCFFFTSVNALYLHHRTR